ncbi:hypothetical protein LIER_05542 [Lithospermum erythrorhizon]|uniref:Uncharacterized protein n=1 Tax=Lithospermum erythrorhizon TaxID=34254 RepID=A0AAV3P1T8_LITER
MKQELMGHCEDDNNSQKSDASMATSSKCNNFQILEDMQDAQDPNESVQVEDIFEAFKDTLKEKMIGESSSKKNDGSR